MIHALKTDKTSLNSVFEVNENRILLFIFFLLTTIIENKHMYDKSAVYVRNTVSASAPSLRSCN